jgi:hypothetical protein
VLLSKAQTVVSGLCGLCGLGGHSGLGGLGGLGGYGGPQCLDRKWVAFCPLFSVNIWFNLQYLIYDIL